MFPLITPLSIPKAANSLGVQDQFMTIGSCFSDEIGLKLAQDKRTILVNPFGTSFNPLAIFDLVKAAITKQTPQENLYVQRDGLWFHHQFHSSFFAESKKELALLLETKIAEVHSFLQTTNLLVITFGTAYVHEHKTSGVYVNNCHKIPEASFAKSLLHVKQICQGFESMLLKLKGLNPTMKIVLTVSPVRHTKEGLAQNQLSKSILRASCHYLELDFEEVSYFPSYELMIDELRDYRFYKSDLIHPNEQAVAYIYERFKETYFSDDLQVLVTQWNKLQIGLSHRSQQEGSEVNQAFLKKMLAELQNLSGTMELDAEIKALQKRIFV
jgi:hypothetical protein